MAYDRADWHYGGDFPDDVPNENGATHIGIYLGWVIKRGLVGELHVEESVEALEAVRSGRSDGRTFLIEECDEKFTDEDLSDVGKRFTDSYYDETYNDDYIDTLDTDDAETAYHYENSPENQALMEAVLDQRFEEWRREHAPDVAPLRTQAAPPTPEPAPAPVARPAPKPSRAPKEKPWWRIW